MESWITNMTRNSADEQHVLLCWKNSIRSWDYAAAGLPGRIKPGCKGKPFGLTKIQTRPEQDSLYQYAANFGFWSYLSHFAFTTLKDAPVEKVDEDASWFRKINLGENKYRNTITVSCFLIGYGILAAAWLFSLRSVRFLILRKGGQKVSLVTYGPFGKNRIMEVPVNCISAQESRDAARVQLPLKVKNRAFYFILDMRGEFLNTRLYDHTAGLRRKL
ncbi:unnamed protein product [Hermetia illucens]|uniref:Transmembrane protein 223 n=1 Tax=Hermetia illucens TaxID=343691 RepID=A0A7R8UCL3_HERIL|nr:unnamed protein product [Hermetia illucens]